MVLLPTDAHTHQLLFSTVPPPDLPISRSPDLPIYPIYLITEQRLLFNTLTLSLIYPSSLPSVILLQPLGRNPYLNIAEPSSCFSRLLSDACTLCFFCQKYILQQFAPPVQFILNAAKTKTICDAKSLFLPHTNPFPTLD